MKMRAVYDGVVLAESDQTAVRDGERYFPWESVCGGRFTSSDVMVMSVGRGRAVLFTVAVGDAVLPQSAWSYVSPVGGWGGVEGMVAFAPPVVVAGAPIERSYSR